MRDRLVLGINSSLAEWLEEMGCATDQFPNRDHRCASPFASTQQPADAPKADGRTTPNRPLGIGSRRRTMSKLYSLGSRALVAGGDASTASTVEAGLFSRQTSTCCVCRFFRQSDEEYPCVRQQTYPLHFTVEWASFISCFVDAFFAHRGQCATHAGRHESEVPSVFDWQCDAEEVHDALVEQLLPWQARGHHGRHRVH